MSDTEVTYQLTVDADTERTLMRFNGRVLEDRDARGVLMAAMTYLDRAMRRRARESES